MIDLLFADQLLTSKMFYAVCIFNIIMFIFSAAEELPLPPVTICKRNSTNYFNCLKLALEEAWPRMVKGPSDFGLPSLDPMTYEFGKAVFDINLLHGEVNISNFVFEGLAKTRFISVKVYFLDDDFRVVIDVQIPKVTGSGECAAVGSVGGLRINGKGYFNLTLEGISGPQSLTGHVANDRLTVKHVNVAPSIKKLKAYFDLFDGNKELNDLVITFVNEYWPSLYRAALPIASKVWEPWFCDLANHLVSKVSFSKLFP